MMGRNPVRFIEKNFDTWDSAHEYLSEIINNNQGRYIFRGQEDNRWGIISSFERLIGTINQKKEIEQRIAKKFKRGIENYINRGQKNHSILDTLILMQHYGTPTRLVDFSRSLYIALFFAFQNECDAEYSSIWAINRSQIETLNILKLKEINVNVETIDFSFFYTENEYYRSNSKIFEDVIIKEHDTKGLLLIEPDKLDIRMLAQQSIFLLSFNINFPFMENFNSYDIGSEKYPLGYKVNIKKKERLKVLRVLDSMNINTRTLFPGLDGFAKSFLIDIELQIEEFRKV